MLFWAHMYTLQNTTCKLKCSYSIVVAGAVFFPIAAIYLLSLKSKEIRNLKKKCNYEKKEIKFLAKLFFARYPCADNLFDS